MPKRQLDPNEPRKAKPTKVRKATKGKKWEHVDRVGDWDPVVPSVSDETSALTKKERDSGKVKITREDRLAERETARELEAAQRKAERREARQNGPEGPVEAIVETTDVEPA